MGKSLAPVLAETTQLRKPASWVSFKDICLSWLGLSVVGMKRGLAGQGERGRLRQRQSRRPCSSVRRALGRPARWPGNRPAPPPAPRSDRKSTRLNSSHSQISYAVFCLKKKKKKHT